MSPLDDIKALHDVLNVITAIQDGPLRVSISAPVHIVVQAQNGKVLLDTTLQINWQEPQSAPSQP